MSSRRSRSGGTAIGTHVQAVVEVLAEAPGGDLGLEVARGRGEHAHVDLARLRVADAAGPPPPGARAAASPGARAAARRSRRGTACRRRPPRTARGARVGAGEGALRVPEQLALEQRLRDRRAVDRDEGLARAAATARGSRARRSSLPVPLSPVSSTVALNAGGALDQLEHLDHRLGAPPRSGARPLARSTSRRSRWFSRRRRSRSRALRSASSTSEGCEGLGEVVVGAALHRLDRELRRAVGGHQDHGGSGAAAPAGAAARGRPCRACADRRARPRGRDLELAQGGFGVGCASGFIALGREHQLQALAQGVVIVDDQDASGHGCETRIGRPARRREGFRGRRAPDPLRQPRWRASAGLPARGGDPPHKEAASLALKSA